MSDLQTEINACRPLCLRIGGTDGGGHFVALTGYGIDTVNVADPWYGTSTREFSGFPASYQGGGGWTHTYLTKS